MSAGTSGLLDRHLGFVAALRAAGLPVSLTEDLDAVAALRALDWDQREVVRAAYAATLVKRRTQRPTFDALFDVYFPALVGDGVAGPTRRTDGPEALSTFRDELVPALAETDPGRPDGERRLRELAAEMVGRFGAMPGRGPGLSSWSAYTALQRVAPQELVDRLVAALVAEGRPVDAARREAGHRVGRLTALVEGDARRRIAEEKGADHVARLAVAPTIDRLDFTAARRSDLEQMRREIYPLARRLATRLTREQHARRRGPLDFRRTVRASLSAGGVPLATHHRPRRPHRTDLVVLCDVSGSVASFAQFTLLLVHALREQLSSVRAFTFVDHVHEVTDRLRPGADPADVLAALAASGAHASRWGRTDYGRAFAAFEELHGDALGPRSSLLVLGDARSNHADLRVDVLRRLAGQARRSWWLNPEHRRHWDTGDSAASRYGEVVPMVECRNLTQLAELVHDIV